MRKYNDKEVDDAFFRLIESLSGNKAAIKDLGVLMVGYRDADAEANQLRAVVAFFRNALPWAMRKSGDVENGAKPPWME
jgi:hypothetical protein